MTYEEMRHEERDECAVLAARAFKDYEYFSIYVEDDKKRYKFLENLFRCEFKANADPETVKFFTVKEDGKILGVCQLCTPKHEKPEDLDYVKAGWLKVLMSGGSKAVNAWNAMEKQASAPCHGLTGETWYISLLTIAPEAQGKGVGSALLQNCIIPYVKEQGASALSLFTNSEENRIFYAKNGFFEFDEKRFSYNGKTIGNWSCIKEF